MIRIAKAVRGSKKSAYAAGINNFRMIWVSLLIACAFAFTGTAGATIEIMDIFSDFTSSDVTIRSDRDVPHGTAVFELMYEGEVVESQEVPFQLRADEPVSKVVSWQKKPQGDYYTAKVSIYNGSNLFDSKSYQVSYGTVTMPSFHIIDLSPSNTGVQMLLRPFNPSVADIRIELLNNNDIVYTETEKGISLTSNRELKMDWPFLLSDKGNYTVRTKIFTHRLYASPLINTYTASFIASDDVEILSEDIEVDEYGASVTLRGNSQVPFDGFIDVSATNRATNEKKTYRQQVEEILVTGKEDTAGIVWKELGSGTYDVNIRAVNKDNIALDKYETVLRIPEADVESETPATASTPALAGLTGSTGLVAIVIVIAILAVFKRKRGG